jgi:hypothetical protein
MIRYELGDVAAVRRAWAVAAVRAMMTLAPLVLALELGRQSGWTPRSPSLALAAAVCVLLATQSWVQGAAVTRRLRALRVFVDDDTITAEIGRDARSIARSRVVRIVEIAGALGGMRVESDPDPRTGVPVIVTVPCGGEGFGDVRAHLERWRGVERRGKRGPFLRILSGVAVIAAVFFLPFALDDFVVRSKLVAALLVVFVWLAMRWKLRAY